jgi:WD40 repeat protein
LTLLLPEEPTAIVVSLTVAYIALKSGNIIAFNLITMGFDSSIDSNGPVSLEVLEEHLDTMKHHKNTVTSLCLNASGDKLFSSDTKGVLMIWDLESNQMIKTLDTGFEILQLESGLKQINLFMQSKNAPAAISPVLARTTGSTAEQNVLCEMELYSVDDLLQGDTSHLPVSSSSNGSKDKQLQLENEELKLKYASLSDLYSKMTKMAGQALSKSADEVVDR